MIDREALQQLIQEMEARANQNIKLGAFAGTSEIRYQQLGTADGLREAVALLKPLLVDVLVSPPVQDQKNQEDTRVDRQCAPTDSPTASEVAPSPTNSGDPQPVLTVKAAYVLGGWSRDVADRAGLVRAVTDGIEASPIAEVTIRSYPWVTASAEVVSPPSLVATTDEEVVDPASRHIFTIRADGPCSVCGRPQKDAIHGT